MNRNKEKENHQSLAVFGFTLLSIVLWVFCFDRFLTGELGLKMDAIPYYEHIKYFIDSLGQGVYPLWDPTYNLGVSNEFFLRRIGSYNPFYFILVLMCKAGIPYKMAYMCFMSLYFFLGMAGFYKLCRLIYDDSRLALMGYVLLAFSTLSTILFNSYIVLIITPMIWFVYFSLAFIRQQKSVYVVGLSFALMLLLTTYIPFYFLSIIICILLFLGVCYPQKTVCKVKEILRFVIQRPVISLLCILAVSVSVLPGLSYYLQANSGDFVMPIRHHNIENTNTLAVAPQTYVEGGIVTRNLVQNLLANLSELRLGEVYLPMTIHLFFLLGLIASLNRRIIIILGVGLVYFFISVYEAGPLYRFLYDNVFFFKYMRNFQYFLWFVILPAYVLLSVEHLRVFIDLANKNGQKRWWLIGYVCLIHIIFLWILTCQDQILLSSYIITFISMMTWVIFIGKGYVANVEKRNWLLWGLLIISLVQPVEIYKNLTSKAKVIDYKFTYDQDYMVLKDVNGEQVDNLYNQVEILSRPESQYAERRPLYTWYAMRWTDAISKKIRVDILKEFQSFKFIFFDTVELLGDQQKRLTDVEQSITGYNNIALVEQEASKQMDLGEKREAQASIVLRDDPRLKVINYGRNEIEIETNLSESKFLVYNDSYDKKWRAMIDGKEVEVLRSNVAFKGLWVPAGKSSIKMVYGSGKDYFYHYSIMACFSLMLLWLIMLIRREKYQI